MAKKKAGLPESFDLRVERPVDLGDYLDEEAFTAPDEGMSRNFDNTELSQVRKAKEPDRPGDELKSNPAESRARKPQNPRPKRMVEPPRKQVNMKPDTLRKADELVRIIQERGPQRDAAASEMFDAVIATLYDAKDQIDLSNVPKRGRWGSPTASAFVAAIGEAFAHAISRRR